MIVDTALSPAEAYHTFNMGLGLAVALPSGEVQRAVGIAADHGIAAWEIGRVEDQSVASGEPLRTEESEPLGESVSEAQPAGESLRSGDDPAISIFGIPEEWQP